MDSAFHDVDIYVKFERLMINNFSIIDLNTTAKPNC